MQVPVQEKEKEPGLVKVIVRPRHRSRQADRVAMRILQKLPVRTLQRKEKVQGLSFRISELLRKKLPIRFHTDSPGFRIQQKHEP